jgi:Sec-independent protein translocase protein TatA
VEIAVIAVIFLIFFGAGKLGDVGGMLGKTARELKDAAGWGADEQPIKQDENKPLTS